jgi:branched-chain amino acid aminotransferase
MKETEKIWMNGELVDWADARVHVGTHGLHYGTGFFEGIRCYATERGPAVFRLTDHLKRFENSGRLLYMELPYSIEDMRAACFDAISAAGLDECYLRPIAFYGYGELGVHPGENPVDVAVMCFPWGAYLGEESQQQGVRVMVSSWRRVGPNTIPHAAKATGVYLNSMLATQEARRGGYDEAVLLTEDGKVADGPGETIFAIRDGVMYTPDLSASILPGVTRDSLIQISQDLGYTVVEKAMIRSDLYTADELFMAGTAVEVTPVRSIDDHEIGIGPVTLALQAAYRDTVTGKSERWAQWLDYARAPNPA